MADSAPQPPPPHSPGAVKAAGGGGHTIQIKHLVAGMGYIYPRCTEWASKFPEASGSRQSPVDISSRHAIYDASLNVSPLQFQYALCRETDMCNNGQCVVVYPRHKPQGDSGYRLEQLTHAPRSLLSGGPFPGLHEYELAEFRFHWGRDDSRGSEHTVNGKAFPLELQLIHWNNALYPSLEEALGKPGGIAIVAIFIQIGREHTGLKFMTEHLEDIWYKGKHVTIATAFNPSCLLPDPMLRDYWTYDGSLTSPPCSESVTWIILRYPLMISSAQMEEFRRLRTHCAGEPWAGEREAGKRGPGERGAKDRGAKDRGAGERGTGVRGSGERGAGERGVLERGSGEEDGMLVDNFRPIQPLHDRKIRANFPL